MQVASSAPALDLTVVVDPDAEPTDWGEAIVEFLIRVVEKRIRQRTQTPATDAPAVRLAIYKPPEQ